MMLTPKNVYALRLTYRLCDKSMEWLWGSQQGENEFLLIWAERSSIVAALPSDAPYPSMLSPAVWDFRCLH
jgi:hypothetical protein